jgi:hypothetical protein
MPSSSPSRTSRSQRGEQESVAQVAHPLPGRGVVEGTRVKDCLDLLWQQFSPLCRRKVVSPNDFTNLDQVEQRLAAFEHRYNAKARPFTWRFTPADLDDLLAADPLHDRRRGSPSAGHLGYK